MSILIEKGRKDTEDGKGSQRREEETPVPAGPPAPATVSTLGHPGGREETTKILSALLWRDSSDSWSFLWNVKF